MLLELYTMLLLSASVRVSNVSRLLNMLMLLQHVFSHSMRSVLQCYTSLAQQ